MLDEVGHVGELLLEVALVGLQALEQVGAVGKRAAEMEPSVPAMPICTCCRVPPAAIVAFAVVYE